MTSNLYVFSIWSAFAVPWPDGQSTADSWEEEKKGVFFDFNDHFTCRMFLQDRGKPLPYIATYWIFISPSFSNILIKICVNLLRFNKRVGIASCVLRFIIPSYEEPFYVQSLVLTFRHHQLLVYRFPYEKRDNLNFSAHYDVL